MLGSSRGRITGWGWERQGSGCWGLARAMKADVGSRPSESAV